MTWEPLSKAFEHVLQHERDHYVSKRLLLLALCDGRVRARGYEDSAYGEGVRETLDRSWFKTDEEAHIETRLNVEANSLRHGDGWRDADGVTFYRLELVWEDLIVVWPECGKLDGPTKKIVKRLGVSGRPSYLHLVCAEAGRRLEASEDKPSSTLIQFARDLHAWWQGERLDYEPVLPEGSVKGIENAVRELWHERRGN